MKVKCIQAWEGGPEPAIVGRVYDTSLPPPFSNHSWKSVLQVVSDEKPYFIELKEEEQINYEIF